MLKYIELTCSNLVMETLSLNIVLELSFILKLINFSFVSKLFCQLGPKKGKKELLDYTK